MDIDSPMDMGHDMHSAMGSGMTRLAGTARTGATILCCNCGAPIDGTSSAGAMCFDW